MRESRGRGKRGERGERREERREENFLNKNNFYFF